jgi:hypothetical protein
MQVERPPELWQVQAQDQPLDAPNARVIELALLEAGVIGRSSNRILPLVSTDDAIPGVAMTSAARRGACPPTPIASARRAAALAGVSDRVPFEVTASGAVEAESYDLFVDADRLSGVVASRSIR